MDLEGIQWGVRGQNALGQIEDNILILMENLLVEREGLEPSTPAL